nr:MAG TPA: hypothetical protein [Caudoviricetes sp.]
MPLSFFISAPDALLQRVFFWLTITIFYCNFTSL